MFLSYEYFSLAFTAGEEKLHPKSGRATFVGGLPEREAKVGDGNETAGILLGRIAVARGRRSVISAKCGMRRPASFFAGFLLLLLRLFGLVLCVVPLHVLLTQEVFDQRALGQDDEIGQLSDVFFG